MKKNNTSSYKSIPEFIINHNNSLPTLKWLNIKTKENQWKTYSLDGFKEQIVKTALYLKAKGVKKGVNVGVMSLSSPDWLIYDQAIMLLGAVTIPLFSNASNENITFILKQTGLKTVFCNGEEAFKTILEHNTKLNRIIVNDLNVKKIPKNVSKKRFIGYDVVLKQKVDAKKIEAFLKERFSKIKPTDLATIVYTSGSYGTPKGVMLTHESIINQIHGCTSFFPLKPADDRIVTFLPFAHIFERAIIYYYLSTKAPIYFAPFLAQVGNIIREVKPTFMTTVPRLLHKIYERIYFNVKNSSKLKNLLARTAIRRAENKIPNSESSFADSIFEKVIYQKLRAALGGELKVLVSGGAAVDRTLYRFFYNIGIPIREGYGLTETSPVISANTVSDNMPYSVGKLFPNVKVKLAKDGEILVKGVSVMQGYYKAPKLTKEAFTKDKWFKTGDIGKFDKDFLFVSSRKKELFKNNAGKYITPVKIESSLTKNPYIENALVIGDNKKYVTAVLFLNKENTKALGPEELNQEIRKLIDKINATLNPWERVAKFELSTDDLSISAGELTPKMSIRREVLMKKYDKLIEKMYS